MLSSGNDRQNASFRRLTDEVFRAASDGVWLLDGTGHTLWSNDRLSAMFGESAEQLRSRSFLVFSLDESAGESFAACMRERSEQQRDMPFARPSSVAWARVRLIPFGEYGDSATTVLAMITDITRERQAQAAMLRAVEELERRVRGDDTGEDTAQTRPRPEGTVNRERLLVLAGQIAAANKELEAFSYSVSHDLRAPLRSIDGFSRILVERYASVLDERGKDYLGRVRAAAQRMGQLITDMLTLARIARADMSFEHVDVTRMARAICADLAESDRARRVTVSVSDDLTAFADPRLLNVVLTNLLGNAWKFTNRVEEGRIDVTAVPLDGEDGFCIADNGAGFEMKYVDKLFRPFQRLHTDEDFAGTGVGLATVQRIIARHGGSVRAEGVVGGGARIFLRIPRDTAEPAEMTS